CGSRDPDAADDEACGGGLRAVGVGCWLLPSGCWLLPSGCWLLPSRCHLPPTATYHLPPTTYHLPPTPYHLPPEDSLHPGEQPVRPAFAGRSHQGSRVREHVRQLAREGEHVVVAIRRLPGKAAHHHFLHGRAEHERRSRLVQR